MNKIVNIFKLQLIMLVLSTNVFSQATETQEKITDSYTTNTECDATKATIGFQIYKEQIPSDLKAVLSVDEERRDKQLYSMQYDMYISVDFTEDLLYTKKLAFRYRLQIDGTGTLDKWDVKEIHWKTDLKQIGERFYLGKSWYGNIEYGTMLLCDEDPSEQKINAIRSKISQQGEAVSYTENRSYLLIKSDYDCILKIDFDEVAQLKAGEGQMLQVDPGEHILEAISLDGQYKWDMDINTKSAEQQVVRIKFEQDQTDNEIQVEVENVENNATKGAFIDNRDGQSYKTVKIGNQVWMAENLAYNSGSGCWAYDNKSSNVAKYGYLYNYKTAKNVCPSGWHLPSKSDFEILRSNAGSKNRERHYSLKSGGNSGFSALFGGSHYIGEEELIYGNIDGIHENTYFWSSTSDESYHKWGVWVFSMADFYKSAIMRGFDSRKWAFSLRCIKD